MFSNGFEYLNFKSAFCERCNKYNEEVIEEDESCPIEYKISITSVTGDKNDFPYGNLKPLENSCRYACKEFETDDKELMETYKKMMEEKS